MPAHHSFGGFGAGPQPDPIPTGAERMVIRQRPQSLQVALDHAPSDDQSVQKASKPGIPKKNKHLEETYRLKQKLSELQSEHDLVHDSMGRMALDLDEAEQKLGLKTKELEEKEAELAAMQKNVEFLSRLLDQEKQNRVKAEEKLEEEKKSTQASMQQKIGSLLAAVEQKGVKEKDEEVSRLQAEVIRLASVVTAKDEELKNREAMTTESEKRLASQLQDKTAQLEEQIKLRETSEAALAVQQRQASTGLQMAELRHLCDFYQNNSQRLSKQIKLIAAAK